MGKLDFLDLLEEVYLVPQYRQHGIGTRLLEATLNECTKSGCAAIDLEVYTKDSALRRYRQGDAR